MATFAPRKTGAPVRQTAPVSAAKPQAAPTPALRPNAALALPEDLMAELGGYAKQAAAKERPALGRISLKAGQMTYQGNPVQGNAMDVIIVGSSHRNVYYSGPYDPDNISNPDCFAFSEDGDDMEAHENVPQAMVPPASADATGAARATERSCSGCWANAWGSAMRDGRPTRGKACKETRRLILMAADVLEQEDPVAAILAAELAIVDVPVTSVGNYGTLVNTLSATLNLPVWAVVTNLAVTPHARKQIEVHFTPMAPAGDADTIRALMKRRDEALRIALQPYEGSGGEADPDAGKAQETAPKVNASKFAARPAAKAAPAKAALFKAKVR